MRKLRGRRYNSATITKYDVSFVPNDRPTDHSVRRNCSSPVPSRDVIRTSDVMATDQLAPNHPGLYGDGNRINGDRYDSVKSQ